MQTEYDAKSFADLDTYRRIIGILVKNYDERVKYQGRFDEEDFVLDEIRVIIINYLINPEYGCKKRDLNAQMLASSLQESPYYKFDDTIGEYINQCTSIASDSDDMEACYEKVKKLAYLRRMAARGLRIDYFYDPLNKDGDMAANGERAERLEKTSLEEVIGYFRNEIDEEERKFRNKMLSKDESDASVGLKNLLQRFIDGVEAGAHLSGAVFSKLTQGARMGKLVLRSAPSGVGKALNNSTPIPLIDGTWKTVGEVRPGDKLIGLNGLPTTVLMIHPQQEKKRVYEVILRDGRKVECCEDHLWTYYYLSHAGWKLKTSSLKELYQKKEALGLQDTRGGYRYRLPLPKPVQYPKKELFPSPYVMGLILGDGSFRYSPDQKAFYFSSRDKELPSYIAKEIDATTKRNSEKNYNWSFQFKQTIPNRKNVWVEDILKNYPELWMIKSENKFIPEDYMSASYSQRLELLRGLLDTDGSIAKKCGRVSFASVSYKLIKQTQLLCHSLGFEAHIYLDKRENKYISNDGIGYTLSIQCDKHFKPQLFNLSYKKAIAEKYANSNKREERRDWIAIKDIVKTDRFEDMTCFTVDAEDALFLVGDYIPTHNTRLAVFDACELAYPEMWYAHGNQYNEIKKPNFYIEQKDGHPREPNKVLFITTEMSKDDIRSIILAKLSGINESRIKNGMALKNEGSEEYRRVKHAVNIMEKYNGNFFLEQIENPDMSNVEATIRKYVFQKNVKYVFFDYIFSSSNLIAEIDNSKIREDVLLGMMANKLKNLALEHKIFIMTSTQVSAEGMNKAGFKDENCLRGAKSLADKTDLSCIITRIHSTEKKYYEEEFQNLPFSEPATAEEERQIMTYLIDIYKNRDGTNHVRIPLKINLGTGEREEGYYRKEDNDAHLYGDDVEIFWQELGLSYAENIFW